MGKKKYSDVVFISQLGKWKSPTKKNFFGLKSFKNDFFQSFFSSSWQRRGGKNSRFWNSSMFCKDVSLWCISFDHYLKSWIKNNTIFIRTCSTLWQYSITQSWYSLKNIKWKYLWYINFKTSKWLNCPTARVIMIFIKEMKNWKWKKSWWSKKFNVKEYWGKREKVL